MKPGEENLLEVVNSTGYYSRISPTVATVSPALFYLRAKGAEKSWQGNKTVDK
jgi:hypothetical protein